MGPSLKELWTTVIEAVDYEGHMADVGQAQANAEMVRDILMELHLPPKSRLLFAGSGPGQMFDYVQADFLAAHELVFTDVNAGFIERLEDRARSAGLHRFTALVDDVESPKVPGPFDLAVLVLVLEHVDWRKSLAALGRLQIERFLVVIQKNPADVATNVSPHRELRGSLKAAENAEQAHLVDENDLVRHMAALGHHVTFSERRPVLDGKFMCAFIFESS